MAVRAGANGDEGLVDGALAVVVLSMAGDRHLPEAVRSLVAQRPRPEIVVVSSGGGAVQVELQRAGLDVTVVERSERLLPGAARNVGVRSTKAPYVGFLASDCIALPGWVSGRLRDHLYGAPVVGSLVTNAYPDSRSACAAALLLHHRRMAHAPSHEQIRLGLSFERSLFDRLGLFREDLRAGEDSELKARLEAASVPIVVSEGVRTAHRNPRTPRELLRDQYRRGGRQWRARVELGVPGRRLPIRRIVDACLAWHWAGRVGDRGERRRLRRGWPLLVPGAVAYAAGCFAAARAERSE